MYVRKTMDEWRIMANYGYGLECVCAYNTRKEAKEDLKAYRENEPGISFSVVKKRVPIPAQQAA